MDATFCLGAISMLVLVMLVAMVVVVLRLNKAIKGIERHEQLFISEVRDRSDAYDGLNRRINEEVNKITLDFGEVYREMKESTEKSIQESKSYTDSRIDKVLSKT